MKCISRDCTKDGTVEIEGEPLCPECAVLAKKLAAIIEHEQSKGSVRYGLGAIKGVGRALGEAIASERKKNGPYKSMGDFAARMPPKSMNKKSLAALAKAGAFDKIEPNRATVVHNTELLLAVAKRAQDDEPDMFQ